MVGIILASHGEFANGILQSGSMIFGEQKDVKAVTLQPSEGPDDLRAKMEEAISTFENQDEVLFLVDLWSGTPFNQANLLLNGHEDHWAIVTGLNLPMLIEAYAMRMSTDSAHEIATHICEVARDGVNIRPEELEPKKEEAVKAENPVPAGAIPEGTIDSELFGHEKGAFTGAISDRNGYFAEANGGTIFLDEVGELPLATQARLLRVLESGEFIKVGSSKVQKTDVRIVAATNVNLTEAIAEGRFREDLYYRLNTVPIKIPPLRERGDDITLLFRKFASDFAEKYRMPAIQLTEDAKVLLLAYSWPGNVRQLKNITEQISIIETNRDITAEILRNYLPEQHVNSGLPALFGVKANTGKAFESEREILYQVLFDMRRDVTDLKKLVNTLMAERGAQSVPTAPATTAVSYYQEPQRNLVATVVPATPTIISAAKPAHPVVDDIQDTEEVVEEATLSLDEVEKEMIRKALDRHHGKRKNAAKDLNISERTLYRKIKEYGLD